MNDKAQKIDSLIDGIWKATCEARASIVPEMYTLFDGFLDNSDGGQYLPLSGIAGSIDDIETAIKHMIRQLRKYEDAVNGGEG